MNCKIHEFSVLKVEEKYLEEALLSIIHTVLFNRALGITEPEEVYVELLGLRYVKCKSSVIQRDVDDVIVNLKSQFQKEKDRKNLKFTIYFHEYVEKTRAFFATRIEPSESPWEQWVFGLELLESDFVAERRLEMLGRDLQTILLNIVEFSLNNLNHLPLPSLKKTKKSKTTIQESIHTRLVYLQVQHQEEVILVDFLTDF